MFHRLKFRISLGSIIGFTFLALAVPPNAMSSMSSPAPTLTPALEYPCPIPSLIGIALQGFVRNALDEYTMILSVPRKSDGFFISYVFEVRDSNDKLLASVPASTAKVLADRDDLAIREFTFKGEQTDAGAVSVIETYNGHCAFAKPTIGGSKISNRN